MERVVSRAAGRAWGRAGIAGFVQAEHNVLIQLNRFPTR